MIELNNIEGDQVTTLILNASLDSVVKAGGWARMELEEANDLISRKYNVTVYGDEETNSVILHIEPIEDTSYDGDL